MARLRPVYAGPTSVKLPSWFPLSGLPQLSLDFCGRPRRFLHRHSGHSGRGLATQTPRRLHDPANQRQLFRTHSIRTVIDRYINKMYNIICTICAIITARQPHSTLPESSQFTLMTISIGRFTQFPRSASSARFAAAYFSGGNSTNAPRTSAGSGRTWIRSARSGNCFGSRTVGSPGRPAISLSWLFSPWRLRPRIFCLTWLQVP